MTTPRKPTPKSRNARNQEIMRCHTFHCNQLGFPSRTYFLLRMMTPTMAARSKKPATWMGSMYFEKRPKPKLLTLVENTRLCLLKPSFYRPKWAKPQQLLHAGPKNRAPRSKKAPSKYRSTQPLLAQTVSFTFELLAPSGPTSKSMMIKRNKPSRLLRTLRLARSLKRKIPKNK